MQPPQLAKSCQLKVAGVAKPLSLFVETYGTEQGSLTPNDITNIVKINFDCRPGGIAVSLALREPKYQETAAYCHFGRKPETKNGIKFFEWENAKDLSKYKTMNSAQVEAHLANQDLVRASLQNPELHHDKPQEMCPCHLAAPEMRESEIICIVNGVQLAACGSLSVQSSETAVCCTLKLLQFFLDFHDALTQTAQVASSTVMRAPSVFCSG